MKAEDHRRRQEEILGWPVNIVSYRLGDRYHATVDNVDPGARIGAGEGATREQAERQALDEATANLKQTRRLH